MAWNTPTTVSTGDVLTASRYNADIQANMTELAPFFSAWTSWTTTVTQTSSVTHTVDYAKYLKIGRMVIASCHLTMTGNGGGNTTITVSLPVTAAYAAKTMTVGAGRVIDQNNADFSVVAVMASTTTVKFQQTGTTGSGGGAVGVTPAFTLASPDTVNFTIVYEAAS